MFDPVPSASLADHFTSPEDMLQLFRLRVLLFAKQYKLDVSNRLIGILDCCNSLKGEITKESTLVWDREQKEPRTDVQNKLQLLIYLLGDRGLLYDEHCMLLPRPDEKRWGDSERSYKELAFALRNRHFAALQIESLRNRLNIHIRQSDSYEAFPQRNPEGDSKLIDALREKLHPSIDESRIAAAAKALHDDWLFGVIKPLYLFFALIIKKDNQPYDAARFRKDLKRNKTNFPTGTAPQKCLKQREHWSYFIAIEKSIAEAECDDESEKTLFSRFCRSFEPFSLLIQIRQHADLDLSDKDLAIIANECQEAFLSDARPKEAWSSSVQVGRFNIYEIMGAFYRVLQSQSTCDDEYHVLPYARKKALESGLLNTPKLSHERGKTCSEEDYKRIRETIYRDYETPAFSLSQEAFWLLTGYSPPFDLLLDSDSENLYELCCGKISDIFYDLRDLCNERKPEAAASQKQRSDILNARGFWAANWNDAVARDFCATVRESVKNNNKDSLLKWIGDQYTKIRDKNHNYESFKAIPHVMVNELLEESITLCEIHIREQVISTLIELSQALWPLTPGFDGKTSSSSSQAASSPHGR